MSDTYNLYNLEASFKQFLLSGIAQSRTEPDSTGSGTGTKKQMMPVSIKNYLSDIRHFFGWLILYSKSKQLISTNFNEFQLISIIDEKSIIEYKSYLSENNIPHKTINRRLSTVRKFCSFCISQGWLKENPAKKVGNVGGVRVVGGLGLLKEFEEDLLKENLDSKTVTNYLDDVREFLGLV